MNMIEKVARAMLNADNADNADVVSWDELTSVKAKSYKRHAKAAILAMREPSEEMVKAADVSIHSDFYPPNITWEKMIEAALKEE